MPDDSSSMLSILALTPSLPLTWWGEGEGGRGEGRGHRMPDDCMQEAAKAGKAHGPCVGRQDEWEKLVHVCPCGGAAMHDNSCVLPG